MPPNDLFDFGLRSGGIATSASSTGLSRRIKAESGIAGKVSPVSTVSLCGAANHSRSRDKDQANLSHPTGSSATTIVQSARAEPTKNTNRTIRWKRLRAVGGALWVLSISVMRWAV